jgi:hypothetical protein
LLQEIKKMQPKESGALKGRGGPPPTLETRKTAATDAGMSTDQAKTAIRVSNVPQELFNDQVESDTPPTITRLAELCHNYEKPAPGSAPGRVV